MTIAAIAPQGRCAHGMVQAWCASCASRVDSIIFEKKRERHAPRGVTADALMDLINEDLETGCWLWTGKFKRRGDRVEFDKGAQRPYHPKKHEMCGHTHFEVARLMFEESVGVELDEDLDVVFSTCATNTGDRHPCVRPEHHVLGTRGGER